VPDSTSTSVDFLDGLPSSTPSHDQRPPGFHQGCDCGSVPEAADPWRRGFTRRRVLQGSSAMVAALGLQQVTTRFAFAAPSKAKGTDCVVVVSLRGGMDGLSVVAPTFESRYYQLRPNIAIPKAAALPLARGFGLHPAMTGLHALYRAGKMAPVVAVGTPDMSLSHFEAMDTLERGTAVPGTPSGWLNRVLETRGDKGVFSAVQIGSSLPLELSGDAPALALNGIESFGLQGYDNVKVQAASAFAALYKGVKHPVADQVRDTVAALSRVGTIKPTPDNLAKNYPANSYMSYALMQIARLVKANVGMTFAAMDVGGWDMHTNLGTVAAGDMRNNLTDVDKSLSAFVKDLGTAFKNVTIVLISEFGRTIRENGSVGTDHGHGQLMLTLGGSGIKGGTVYGKWPGLADQAQFINGSLGAMTDYRDVLGEILTKRAGVGSFSKIFPDYKPKPLGLAVAR
jgi:uncharacterized protein (DUF1501 family)